MAQTELSLKNDSHQKSFVKLKDYKGKDKYDILLDGHPLDICNVFTYSPLCTTNLSPVALCDALHLTNPIHLCSFELTKQHVH
jgi:hypothetical protein